MVALQAALAAWLLVQRRKRLRAEAALRRSEAKATALLRMVPDLMFVMSRDGVYLDYHARTPSELFAPPEAFLGKRMRDIFPAEMAEINCGLPADSGIWALQRADEIRNSSRRRTLLTAL